MATLGERLRAARRTTNTTSLREAQASLRERIAHGEDAVSIAVLLHKELSPDDMRMKPISHPMHPDYDQWRLLEDWATAEGLSLEVRTAPVDTAGICRIQATATPYRERMPERVLVLPGEKRVA